MLLTAEPDVHPLLYREPDEAYGENHSKKRKADDSKPRRAATAQQVAHPSVVRMKEMEKINRHRAMGQGSRHNFIFHYRSAVYRAYYPEHGYAESKRIAWEKVTEIAATFDQPEDFPFTDVEVAAACRANPWRDIATNETVADDLEVTPEEVDLLGLTSIVPKEIADERTLNVRNARLKTLIEHEERDLKVKVLLRAGHSYTAIQYMTGVKRSTIRNINEKYKKTGLVLSQDSPLKNQEAHLVAQIEEQFRLGRSGARVSSGGVGCAMPLP